MHIPLNAHILYIETRLHEPNQTFTSARITISERNRIEAKIKFATEALQEYRHAPWLEHLLRADDPGQLLATGA